MARGRGTRDLEHVGNLAGLARGAGERHFDRSATILHVERERARFIRGYDTDGDGRINAADQERFMEWYRGDSLRADIDGDGKITPADLAEFTKRMNDSQSQNR